jgi:hypothetical protein
VRNLGGFGRGRRTGKGKSAVLAERHWWSRSRFLRCADHKNVIGFGRNDESLFLIGKGIDKGMSGDVLPSSEMTVLSF